MPDEFREVTTTGLGKRMGNSIAGILVGIILFFGSFALLYWNEGRIDLSKVAKTAIEIKTGATAPADAEGNLVSIAGVFNTSQKIGDDLYLKPAAYFLVEREVEMYAWVEEKETKTTKNMGGSETTETIYRYKKEWTTRPENASDFNHPEGHYNPSLPFKSGSFRADSGTVGIFSYDLGNIDLPSPSRIALSTATVAPKGGAVLINENYIFKGKGSIDNPLVGDVRVSYAVLKSGFKGTVFGKLDGSSVVAFAVKENLKNRDRLFRIFATDRDTAIETLHGEFVFMMWLFRILGFVAMWFGLSLVFGPISTLLDIVPIFGSITRFVAGGVSFLIALPLSIVTIIVSMVAHSVVALVVAVAVTLAVVIFILMSRKKKAATAK